MPTEIRSDIRETVLRAEGPDLGPTRISAAEETPAYTGRQPLFFYEHQRLKSNSLLAPPPWSVLISLEFQLARHLRCTAYRA